VRGEDIPMLMIPSGGSMQMDSLLHACCASCSLGTCQYLLTALCLLPLLLQHHHHHRHTGRRMLTTPPPLPLLHLPLVSGR
jgi:hypothetical protein